MVNPDKHAKNLNKDDLEEIYQYLEEKYQKTKDTNSKKEYNQLIIIFLLACKRFSITDMTRIPYSYFNKLEKDDLLYEPINRQIREGYCQQSSPLLTDNMGKAYKTEDINQLLLKTAKSVTDKKVCVETLNKTKSRFNDYGKKTINKHKVKEYLSLKACITRQEDEIMKSSQKEDNEKLIEEVEDISSTNKQEDYKPILNEIVEKQDILMDSITNKHNQLSNTLHKIHQKVKATNNKYNQLDKQINRLPVLEDSINKSLNYQNERLDILEEELGAVLEKLEENEEINNQAVENKKDMVVEMGEDLSHNDYKEFMNKWFSQNIKITKSTHDSIDMDQIQLKLDKYLEKEGLDIDKKILYDNLENYLMVWYTKYDSSNTFNDIITSTIQGRRLYTYLKFVDINVERENRIKNGIILWLKEHTREVEESKTYTQDIFKKVKPIFEENGWIITSPEEYTKLHDLGITKVCVNRTFSQIIGKAVQELYPKTKNKTQRDTPTLSGNITYYTNIRILDKDLSDDVNYVMKNELRGDFFDSDNFVYEWLNQNILYTGNDEDVIYYSNIFEYVKENLHSKNINLSNVTLEKLFVNIFSKYLEKYGVELSSTDNTIHGFILKHETLTRVTRIVEDWMEKHVIMTENLKDIVYYEEIDGKILSLLRKENINVVDEHLYSLLQENIVDNFITQTLYEETLTRIVHEHIASDEIEDRIDGKYYKKVKIIKYNILEEEHVSTWINENIEELLKSNVVNKEVIINRFKKYMKEHNLKNMTNYTVENLLDVGISSYYDKKEVQFKSLTDKQNEYYALTTD